MKALLFAVSIIFLTSARFSDETYTIKTVKECETTNYITKCGDAKSANVKIVIAQGMITVKEDYNSTSYVINDFAEDGSQTVYKVSRGTAFCGFVLNTSSRTITWNSSFTNDKNYKSREFSY
jgi:hypothetical protein